VKIEKAKAQFSVPLFITQSAIISGIQGAVKRAVKAAEVRATASDKVPARAGVVRLPRGRRLSEVFRFGGSNSAVKEQRPSLELSGDARGKTGASALRGAPPG
jgi:hypothetical protein